jgi:hypothetical protein
MREILFDVLVLAAEKLFMGIAVTYTLFTTSTLVYICRQGWYLPEFLCQSNLGIGS